MSQSRHGYSGTQQMSKRHTTVPGAALQDGYACRRAIWCSVMQCNFMLLERGTALAFHTWQLMVCEMYEHTSSALHLHIVPADNLQTHLSHLHTRLQDSTQCSKAALV